MHWTGILNLISITLATVVTSYLFFGAGWHWYLVLLLWPVLYLGLPVLIGLSQGTAIRRDHNRELTKLLSGRPPDPQ